MLTGLIKMPKITAKSGEMIDTTTSLVDKMNPDWSLPIHCPECLSRAFFNPSVLVWRTETDIIPFFNDAFR